MSVITGRAYITPYEKIELASIYKIEIEFLNILITVHNWRTDATSRGATKVVVSLGNHIKMYSGHALETGNTHKKLQLAYISDI